MYTFSSFAKFVIKERGISEEILRSALDFPEEILLSKKDPKLSLQKKIYFHESEGEKRLLLLFIKERNNELLVLLVVDTSHVNKYFL